jgi:putative lipoprotein
LKYLSLFSVWVGITLSTQAHAVGFLGMATVGFEVQSFQPCGSDQEYWLALSDADYKKYFPRSEEPYSEKFVYVEGEFVQGEVGEFAREYDGVLEVSSVAIVDNGNAHHGRCKL